MMVNIWPIKSNDDDDDDYDSTWGYVSKRVICKILSLSALTHRGRTTVAGINIGSCNGSSPGTPQPITRINWMLIYWYLNPGEKFSWIQNVSIFGKIWIWKYRLQNGGHGFSFGIKGVMDNDHLTGRITHVMLYLSQWTGFPHYCC